MNRQPRPPRLFVGTVSTQVTDIKTLSLLVHNSVPQPSVGPQSSEHQTLQSGSGHGAAGPASSRSVSGVCDVFILLVWETQSRLFKTDVWVAEATLLGSGCQVPSSPRAWNSL